MRFSIICVYNNKNILDKSLIKTLDEQTFKDYELILIDNTSGQYKNAGEGLNYGASRAQGTYLLFLHQDVAFLNKTALYIVYGYVYMKDMSNNAFKYIVKLDFMYTFRFSPISHQAVFARRALFNSYKFDMAYKIAADQDWIMRCYKNGCTTQFIDVAICNFDMNGISGTDSGKQLYLQEKQLIQKTYYPVRCAIHRLGQNMKEKLGIR